MGGYSNLMNMGMLRPRGGPTMPTGGQGGGLSPIYGGPIQGGPVQGGGGPMQPPMLHPQPIGGLPWGGGNPQPVGGVPPIRFQPQPQPVGPQPPFGAYPPFPQPVGGQPPYFPGGGMPRPIGGPTMPQGWGNGGYNMGNFDLLQQLMQNRGYGGY